MNYQNACKEEKIAPQAGHGEESTFQRKALRHERMNQRSFLRDKEESVWL